MARPKQKGKAGLNRLAVHREAFSHLKEVEFGGFQHPDYVGMAMGYVDAVLSGAVVENQFVILACKRFLEMRKAAESTASAFFWSDAHVFEVCAFMERMPQLDGLNKPEDGLIDLQPWQCWMIAGIFGFRTTSGNQNVRWVREVHFDCPRKMGKTALAAMIDLYCFLYEDEGRSRILLGASTKDQAREVYDPIKALLAAEPELSEQFGLKITAKEVKKPDGGYIKTISAIGRKNDGANPHVAHIDELHAVSTELHEVMESSLGARANQLFLKTTTAGDRMFGPGPDARKRAMEVLKGTQKAPRLFTVIYTVDPPAKGDRRSPLRWENVVMASPNLGVSIAESVLESQMEAAKFNVFQAGEFVTKRLNVYSDIATRAISAEAWAACSDPSLKLEDFKGKSCIVGVDIGVADDHTSILLLFDHPTLPDTPVYFAEHHIGSGNPGLQDESIGDQLRVWAEDGWLTVHEFPVVTTKAIKSRVVELAKNFDISEIVFDQKDSYMLIADLQEEKLPAGAFKPSPVEATEPTRDIIDRANHGLLRHDGNPMLAWNVVNVTVSGDEIIRFKKERTTPNMKIDGFAAMVHANAARLGRIAKPKSEKLPPPETRIRAL